MKMRLVEKEKEYHFFLVSSSGKEVMFVIAKSAKQIIETIKEIIDEAG